jgi:hypothetical protein
MKYILCSANIPPIHYSIKDEHYSVGYIEIGGYIYSFSKNSFPIPDLKIQYKKHGIDLYSGIRLDVVAIEKKTETGLEKVDTETNDLGNQQMFMSVISTIYRELELIANSNNVFIVNDTHDSKKRDSIYDRFAKKLCLKYNMKVKKFNLYSETIRYVYREK